MRAIVSGSERVNPATLKRFTDRFARFNLRDSAFRPSYGLAEATVYVGDRQSRVNRRRSSLSTLTNWPPARRSGAKAVAAHRWSVIGCAASPIVRIVDPDTTTECPAGMTGEIWVHGDNVALGYWQKPDETEHTFRARLSRRRRARPKGRGCGPETWVSSSTASCSSSAASRIC